MRELELAGYPSIDPPRALGARGRAEFALSRMAFAVSVIVHVVAGYALSRQHWPDALPVPERPRAEYFLFEMPRVPPPAAEPIVEPAPVPESAIEPAPEPLPPVPQPRAEPEPAPRAAESVAPAPAPYDEFAPPPPTAPIVRVPTGAELAEARERAANDVISARSAESEYLTFSIDDVAPPRPEPEPKPERSIFDGGGGPDFGGRSVGTVGQQRTKLGRKMAELCNALTGGIGVGFGGFGLFSACARPDGRPSGLFPEVRPAYLDLMPECVDTRDTAPALALEAPFSTVKCRLVKKEDLEAQP